jgi:hypothetical protein
MKNFTPKFFHAARPGYEIFDDLQVRMDGGMTDFVTVQIFGHRILGGFRKRLTHTKGEVLWIANF